MDYQNVERFKPIFAFPRYEISSFGRVLNIKTQRDMVLSPTMHGVLTVGLMNDGVQYRRSVKVLVARAFVPGESSLFNTPIQKDDDQTNLNMNNIVWRPRGFAWEYTRQFHDPPTWFFSAPIIELPSNRQYKSIMEAAVENGILCKHIRRSILNDYKVFPTGDKYFYMNQR